MKYEEIIKIDLDESEPGMKAALDYLCRVCYASLRNPSCDELEKTNPNFTRAACCGRREMKALIRACKVV